VVAAMPAAQRAGRTAASSEPKNERRTSARHP
jgi:hypothetical protein